MRNMKAKIIKVVVEHKVDDNPDTSWLGEYATHSESNYSIDRSERGEMGRGEYQYFNPNWQNYKGESEENIRKYCGRDYRRMEALNAGQWCFIGIIAKAEVVSEQGICQTIRSGGLWGIESDSDKEYLDSVAKDELCELGKELESLGMGKRAVEYAIKHAVTVDK
jgi:hypothetical protein